MESSYASLAGISRKGCCFLLIASHYVSHDFSLFHYQWLTLITWLRECVPDFFTVSLPFPPTLSLIQNLWWDTLRRCNNLFLIIFEFIHSFIYTSLDLWIPILFYRMQSHMSVTHFDTQIVLGLIRQSLFKLISIFFCFIPIILWAFSCIWNQPFLQGVLVTFSREWYKKTQSTLSFWWDTAILRSS